MCWRLLAIARDWTRGMKTRRNSEVGTDKREETQNKHWKYKAETRILRHGQERMMVPFREWEEQTNLFVGEDVFDFEVKTANWKKSIQLLQ
ncbi:uncharacterized protein LOC129144958 isoform X4 [Talpa occidentalis]|uniref:uncharacterized protein LOC129144958 isoform X4 n=1 Tax=Talpa occidentalis TaxID=50954 RepID=UPI0023F6F109|nr:uncharacterized protein LOC129144958 isoform X4 [Talpa occidentalis]